MEFEWGGGLCKCTFGPKGRKADWPPAAMRAKRAMSEEVAREGVRKQK
jgi:hypothetical protein